MEGYVPEEEKYGWNTSVTYEEAMEHLIGVFSTLPGTDKVTVSLLKECWNPDFGEKLRGLL